jgi:hypothetical protein
VYDYWLGGKDNFAADRDAAEEAIVANPGIIEDARANRAFLGRTVSFLARDRRVAQFLDIGTGLPSDRNTHEIAQSINPAARVVYVDNDPMVLAHGRALLDSTLEGKSVYIEADMREPEKILEHPVTRDTLDFSKPVALMLVAILHFAPDEYRPAEAIATLLDALPSGSYLAASHLTTEYDQDATSAGQQVMRSAGIVMQKRDSGDFAKLAFTGLELVPPGVVLVSQWRRDATGPVPAPHEVNCYGGVGRKP